MKRIYAVPATREISIDTAELILICKKATTSNGKLLINGPLRAHRQLLPENQWAQVKRSAATAAHALGPS